MFLQYHLEYVPHIGLTLYACPLFFITLYNEIPLNLQERYFALNGDPLLCGIGTLTFSHYEGNFNIKDNFI